MCVFVCVCARECLCAFVFKRMWLRVLRFFAYELAKFVSVCEHVWA